MPRSSTLRTEIARYADLGRLALLEGLLERIGDGLLLIDAADGCVVEANAPACRLLNKPRDAVLGAPVWRSATFWRDAGDWHGWCARMEAEAVNLRPRAMTWTRDDGSTIEVDARVYPIAEGGRFMMGLIVRDATEARRAEVAMRARERHYQNVVDNSADGYYALDLQRRFVEVNDSLCRMFDTPREEWLGRTPLDFVSAQSRTELLRQMGRIETTEHRRYQLAGRRRDGSEFPILLNTTTMHDDAGAVIGAFGFITDLTPVVAAQQAVVESERELRRVLDCLQDTYYRTDTGGRVVQASPAVTALLGYTPDELIGRPLADLYCTPAEREGFLRRLREAGGKVANAETQLRRKDGSEVWVLTNAQYVFDADGRVTGVEGTTRDNTGRRQAEQALRLAARVFADSGEGIMITDARNRIVSVNRAFTAVTGYAEEEVIGRNPRLLESGRHGRDFFRAMWAALRDKGIWRGEVWNRRKNGEVFPEWLGVSAVRDESGAVTHYVAIFTDITERKAVEARIEFLAHHDPLTRLPNRVLFRDRFGHALAYAGRGQRRVALLVIDLDRFKAVNDSLGHPVGDELLREVAGRLSACVRDTDTVSRQGGDEFLVALADIADAESAAGVAEKIMAALAQPFTIQGAEVGISCSIGIAMYPEDGGDLETLLKRADTAMYHAKDAGRNAYRFHTEAMTVDTMERLRLQGRLRRAIEQGEFVVHYQPLIDLATGRIVGAEALVRWAPPGEAMIPPARFIPVAEHTGLIVPLGDWVMREACRELGALRRAGHADLSIAVNLSAIQFRRGDVEEVVVRALAESGLPADALELELTESVLLQGEETVLGTVRRLKALGVRLAIDDFGTGYSSLAYLKRFAVDKLKIDQSFVRDLIADADDAAIVQAVIQMAKSLKLQVLAEGVETEAVAAGLRALDCDMVQGYWFGRPMPAAEFRALLERR